MCGDWAAEAVQLIEEVDTQGPAIVLQSPLFITCGDGEDVSPNNAAVGWPVARDACQGDLARTALRYADTIAHVVRRPPHCLDAITRVWSAVDGCGNSANTTQLIYATRQCRPCGTPDTPCPTQ